MTQENQRTEKEVDDLVVAQADDPTAWEEEAHVKPRRWKVNPSRMGLAAKFFVLSALHRLGADAKRVGDGSSLLDAYHSFVPRFQSRVEKTSSDWKVLLVSPLHGEQATAERRPKV